MYVTVRQDASGLTCNKTLMNAGRNTSSHSQTSTHFTPALVITCFTCEQNSLQNLRSHVTLCWWVSTVTNSYL